MPTNSLHFMRFDLEEISTKLFLSPIDSEYRFISNEITNFVIDAYFITYFN